MRLFFCAAPAEQARRASRDAHAVSLPVAAVVPANEFRKHASSPHLSGTAYMRGAEITCFRLLLQHALKGLALPRASHSGEIALSGSRRLCSTLAAAPVL